ncbi:MAG TPA: penicillin-binding transpeptidase domain-containing protein, partial [Chitinispirillaceae bacterium]|nr:penicillin-binding transpeptidase domain-containing protein [Chitinispirillaceae bacterium]
MNQFRLRLYFISILLSLGGVLIIARLFSIQVLDSKRYAERSRDQTQHRHILTAQRGSILDRKGVVLASSIEHSISVKPEVLGVNASGQRQTQLKRVYPLGDIAGPLLGYVGTDGYGLGGVEFAFDNFLRGEDGWTILQKDGRNKKYRKIGLPSKEPRNGYNLVLSIDSDIQKIVQTVLRQTVSNLNAKSGVCIVMDPHSGRVLAMANEPSFNPNVPLHYSLAQRQNRCISANYEPGSTFKLITAAAALQENIKKESDLIFGNNGVFQVYDQVIRDHVPYGYLTFTDALAKSSNVCFAKIANDVGNETLYRYTRDFGFGTKTRIDLPGEESGIVHPVRSWSGRTRVTMAIGQEIMVTFQQMVLPFAAVANGGILVTPRIYERIESRNGEIIDSSEYKPVRRILSEDVASRLRVMLRKVVDEGTGKNAAIEGVSVAGKTGTAQKPDSGTYSQTRSWSSFIGFVPAENPVLLCGVMIDEPARGEMGGVAAAPAFRKMMSQIISHPELEFAQKILRKNKAEPEQKKQDKKETVVPFLCGLDRKRAEQLADSAGIRCRLSGNGSKVTYQIPSPGTVLRSGSEVVLYFDLP